MLWSHASSLTSLGGAGVTLRYNLFDVDVLGMLLEHLVYLVRLLRDWVKIHHSREVWRFVALAEELVLNVF